MCSSKTLMCCLPMLVVIALACGLGYYFATRPNNSLGVSIRWPTLEDFHREQPWNASSPTDAQRWPNNGRGLELELLNALDSDWYSYFEAAVADWDAGLSGIDPLTLTTSDTTVDSTCDPVDGYLKVCNGDYGDTGWNGINQVIMAQGSLLISSSTAKMNEYYLSHGSNALKQYTMCHEIGHGFGLPHTDEQFWNRDLGNCMDYTLTPSDNMHPDITNFQFLQALYGTANSSAMSTASSGGNSNGNGGSGTFSGGGNGGNGGGNDDDTSGTGSSSAQSSNWNQATQDAWAKVASLDTQENSNAQGGGGRSRQRGRELPGWIMDAWEAVSDEFSSKPYGEDTASERHGWRMLRSHGNLRTHVLDIGQGYSIVVNVLLADGYQDRRLA